MNQKLIIGIVLAIVIIGGAWMFTANNNDSSSKSATQNAAMNDDTMMAADPAKEEAMKDDAMMAADPSKDDAMMAADPSKDESMKDDTMMEGGAGTYEKYDASKIAMAKDGKVVLFFKASWCPSCLAVDKDIKDSLKDIPSGVTILEVDYDKETDLKKKYGVTSQHTFVQVDANGDEMTKWVGANTLEAVVSKLK